MPATVPDTITANTITPETVKPAFVSPANNSQFRRLSVENIMAALRYLRLKVRYPSLQADLFFIGPNCDIRLNPNSQVSIGRAVCFRRDFTGSFRGNVTIEHDVFFNRGCYVASLESVTIGHDTILGEYVSIHDENHVFSGSGPIRARGYTTKPIVIGSNAWIGAKATILAGVTIGDNAVIGANAVVTHDVPPFSIALGIPARIVKRIDS